MSRRRAPVSHRMPAHWQSARVQHGRVAARAPSRHGAGPPRGGTGAGQDCAQRHVRGTAPKGGKGSAQSAAEKEKEAPCQPAAGQLTLKHDDPRLDEPAALEDERCRLGRAAARSQGHGVAGPDLPAFAKLGRRHCGREEQGGALAPGRAHVAARPRLCFSATREKQNRMLRHAAPCCAAHPSSTLPV